MPFYEFLARVDGLIYAENETDARQRIRISLGKLGNVDIEEIRKEEDDEKEDEDDRCPGQALDTRY